MTTPGLPAHDQPPGVVPVTDTARAGYAEAVRMRPAPNREFGPGSTDNPLPEALQVIDLAAIDRPDRSTPPFDQVLHRRRSIRIYGPLHLVDLVDLLESVFALRAFTEADDAGTRWFRPIPSAGARHPLIPLLLIDNVDQLPPGLWRYDPDGHQLLLVRLPENGLDDEWTMLCAAGEFATRPPAVVVLAARFDATLARYPEGASLVWRDAGVALGSLHLAATSLGLGSCILGTAGVLTDEDLAACGIAGTLAGDVGALAVGARTSQVDSTWAVTPLTQRRF